MTVQLYDVRQAPSFVPIWPDLLADLCHPPAERLARVLGLSVRTVRRYNRDGQAPRAVCLALFWLTSYGRSSVHAQAVNDARVAVGYVESLRRRVIELEQLVQHLQAIGHFGAANEPGKHPPRPRNPSALPR